jgi:hypothetical protein
MQTVYHLMQNIILYELCFKKKIESYDYIMEQYPNYPKMWWYNLRRKSNKYVYVR